MSKVCFDPVHTKGFDHVTPLCRGGRHTASNLVPCCARCNISKSTGAAPRGTA